MRPRPFLFAELSLAGSFVAIEGIHPLWTRAFGASNGGGSMNRSLFLAACFSASAGAAAAGAAGTFGTRPYLGSDTEYNITNEAMLQANLGNRNSNNLGGAWNAQTSPIGDYQGGGSGSGELAMVNSHQFTAPMSRMLKGGEGQNACLAAQTFPQNASGIVTGIDAIRVYGSSAVMNNTATCNASPATPCTSDPSGLAFSAAAPGAAALGLGNWRDVLCPDGSTCNPSAFQPSCADGISTCVGFGVGLTHAWRLDDLSGAADVFANLLLLEGAVSYDPFGNVIPPITMSGAAVNGVGVSPYCNALNWDWSEQGGGNTGNCDDGSLLNCTTGQLCADGTYCLVQCSNTADKHFVGPGGIPVPGVTDARRFHHIPPVTCGTGSGTDWRCGGTANVTSAVWGWPQGVALEASILQPQVQPTSYQDNDPLRTPCLGTGVATRPAEDVCNTDGQLGVVLPIPALDFIGNPGNSATFTQEFPSLTCNGPSQFTNAPSVYKCAPLKSNWPNGICPNNDNGACYIPTNKSSDGFTTQCRATKQTALACERGNCAQDGRVYNLSAYTVPNFAIGQSANFVTINIPQAGPPAAFPFMGAYGRIHAYNTSQNKCAISGAPCAQPASTCADGSQCTSFLTPCQFADATDTIGCLVQADPNSIGFAGSGGGSWEARSPIAINSNEPAAGNTQGIRVNGLGAGASCTPTVTETSPGVASTYTPTPALNYPFGASFTSIRSRASARSIRSTPPAARARALKFSSRNGNRLGRTSRR
jgi:hypothetical protein